MEVGHITPVHVYTWRPKFRLECGSSGTTPLGLLLGYAHLTIEAKHADEEP